MRIWAPALISSCLLAPPAFGQGLSESHDGSLRDSPGAQANIFLRIPFGGAAAEQPRFGFGVFTGCSGPSNFQTEAGQDACNARPLRAIEVSSSFDRLDWTFSLSGAGRRADIASWSPQTGKLSLAGDGGSADWVWIGLGVVAGVGLAAALSGDDDPTLCPDGFVATPLGDGCQPIS